MTQASDKYLVELLAPFSPTRPMQELVVEVNRIFHTFEANQYDGGHPEIHDQLPERLRRMFACLPPTNGGWEILDFGTGTGFASEQALSCLPLGSIRKLTCMDLSPEMLVRCRTRIGALAPYAEFTTSLPQAGAGYNLLLTNAVLHHVPDVKATLTALETRLTGDAWWIAGHEPSSRFYRNPECLRHFAAYRRFNHWMRFLRPSKYWGRLRLLLTGDVRHQTARRCLDEGLFGRLPSAEAIDRVVDVGVAHSREEAEAGRGIDFAQLAFELSGSWTLQRLESYSFMGDLYEGSLPPAWRRACEELRQRFPDDGASAGAVWQRC